MTKEEKNRLLLKLYELLWQDIKDIYCPPLILETEILFDKGLITEEEKLILDYHIMFSMDDNIFNSEYRKSFVLKQTEKLKKEE